MEYPDVEAAIAGLQGELAIIRPARNPSQEFLANLDFCTVRDGIGYVYFYRVDRQTMICAEGLVRMKAEDILDLRKSGIHADEI